MKKALIASLLCFLWVISATAQVVLAQNNTPTETPTPSPSPTTTPNPTLVALETVVTGQQQQLATLVNNQADEKREREFADRDLVWKWGMAVAAAALAVGFLSWVGYGNVKDIKKTLENARDDWKKKVRELERDWERQAESLLDKAIFRFDPSNLPIQLSSDLTKIHQALTHRSLGKIEFYENLDDLTADKLKGVIVISMLDKEKLAESQEKFIAFISKNKLNPATTGIILYTGPNRVRDDVATAFENLVTANYPATVVSNILVVGRGIKIDPPSQKNQ